MGEKDLVLSTLERVYGRQLWLNVLCVSLKYHQRWGML
jgi:hypothetical protein